jgi:murein DD-endopeptidase MepM/ murein hydrolase activator NlpD
MNQWSTIKAGIRPLYFIITIFAVVIILLATFAITVNWLADRRIEASKTSSAEQIAELTRQRDAYRNQYTDVLKVSDRYREAIKSIVDLIYDKNTPVGGASPQLVNPTDEIVLLQLRDLVYNIDEEQKLLSQVKQYLFARKEFIDNFPFVWPVKTDGVPRITSGFGYRPSPFDAKKLSLHAGIDIAGKTGDPVLVTADGTVTYVEKNNLVYGMVIMVTHKNGFITLYAHLSEIDVRRGQDVKRGQVIGKVGVSGESTGPHLHYEVRLGKEPIDPMNFLTVNY